MTYKYLLIVKKIIILMATFTIGMSQTPHAGVNKREGNQYATLFLVTLKKT